jgi:hypothetical protein
MEFSPVQLGNAVTSTTSTAETDLIILNDPKSLQKGLFTFYYGVSMGGNTTVDIRYYAAYVVKPLSGTGAYTSTDWYELPGKSGGTISVVTDGFLRVQTTLSFVDTIGTAQSNQNNAQPAAAAFKATTKFSTGQGTVSVVVMGREN